MAEKSSELRENSGILSDTDKEIISRVASDTDDDFSDRYTDTADDRSLTTTGAAVDEDATEDETAETEQIREQIEETRRGMSETIDAIQEKLSLQNISDQVKETVSEQVNNALSTAKDTVYGATIGKAENIVGQAGRFMKKVGREIQRSEVGRVAANNPFPLLLIGLGVGLLAYQGFGSGSRRRSYRYQSGYDRDYANDYGYDYEGTENFDRRENSSRSLLGSAQSKIGGAASGAYESVSGAASTAVDSVTGAANTAYEGVTDYANRAYSGVTDYASRAKEKAGELGTQAREQYDHYLEENPLAVGAVALAVGAAVGLSLPSTRYEGQLMGEYRQNLLDKAQNAAGDLVDRVKEVASEAKETIKDEARAQGLTGETGPSGPSGSTGTTGIAGGKGSIGSTGNNPGSTSTKPNTGFGSNKI